MIIDCIADLHGHYPELEGGDLLIVAGDLTARDIEGDYVEFMLWLGEQNYKKILLIAGNHDNFMQKLPPYTDHELHIHYLCDSGTEFEGLKIWGSPWTKTFEGMNPHCKAFTFDDEEELAIKFSLIPEDVDILVTHSPPWETLDKNVKGHPCGSMELESYLDYFPKLKLHVFGHIHEAYGTHFHLRESWEPNDIHFVNASHVNERYQPVNKPIRVIL